MSISVSEHISKIMDTPTKAGIQMYVPCATCQTLSGASIVNSEHIYQHFILLLILLNSSKYMPVGPEKLQFHTINLFSVTVKNVLSYDLRVQQLVYVMYIRTPTFISTRLILDMHMQTNTLIFSQFFKVFKISGSYNFILFKNLLLHI